MVDDTQLQFINENLNRIANCLEKFLANSEQAASKPPSELISEAMDAFYEQNPVIADAMKRLEAQTKGGQRAVGRG